MKFRFRHVLWLSEICYFRWKNRVPQFFSILNVLIMRTFSTRLPLVNTQRCFCPIFKFFLVRFSEALLSKFSIYLKMEVLLCLHILLWDRAFEFIPRKLEFYSLWYSISSVVTIRHLEIALDNCHNSTVLLVNLQLLKWSIFSPDQMMHLSRNNRIYMLFAGKHKSLAQVPESMSWVSCMDWLGIRRANEVWPYYEWAKRTKFLLAVIYGSPCRH